MHNSKTRFSNRVENYIRYRPSYPKQIVLDLEMNDLLHKNAVIADVGSGTGISTEVFLSQGYHCIGVEPNQAMREGAERQLAQFSEFVSVNGSAEATTLESESIDLIIAGQAFHWFDQAAAKFEFQRILRPGKSVALIWNERNHGGTAFQAGYEDLLKQFCNDYDQVDYKRVDTEALKQFFSPYPYSTYEYSNKQHFDFEGLKGRLLSSSYCPVEGEPNYEPVMNGLSDLFHSHQTDGQITFDYNTRVYVGQLTEV